MNKPNDPSTVTVDEAVARMVNMEYIPEGFTLTDMTSAFLEEAEVEYENARIEHLPEDQLAILKNRFETCAARHSLTLLLQKELLREFENPTDFNVIISGDSSIEPRVALSSVSSWAADRYGISVSEVPNILNPSNGGNDSAQEVQWEEVTIKIQADYRIAYSFEKGKWKRGKTFIDIGLMGRRKNEPNILGGILIGLSQGKRFPKNASAVASKTAISKLRNALKNLTGLSGDPFYPFNLGDGWKPRFIVVDDRSNAKNRAKSEATHEEFNEDKHSSTTRDYDTEDDAAGRLIDEAER